MYKIIPVKRRNEVKNNKYIYVYIYIEYNSKYKYTDIMVKSLKMDYFSAFTTEM